MQRNSALLSACFSAGVLGAIVNSLAAWLAGRWGVPELAGVHLAPALSAAWLYPRLVWGGLWGLLLFPAVARPRSRRHWVRKGLWVSLLPTLFQLFYVFPHHTPYGPGGLGLGTLTPLFVVFYNGIWGAFTGIFTRMLWGRG